MVLLHVLSFWGSKESATFSVISLMKQQEMKYIHHMKHRIMGHA